MATATIYSYMNDTKLFVQIPYRYNLRGWLKETLGCRPEDFRDNDGKFWWRVSKTHREALIEALQGRSLTVDEVREYNPAVECNTACQNAKKDDCECGCLGRNHGAGGPIPDTTVLPDETYIEDAQGRSFRWKKYGV